MPGSYRYHNFHIAIVLFVIVLVVWRVSSHANYTSTRVVTNVPYRIADRVYTQNLPIHGNLQVLKEPFIAKQRKLLRKTVFLLSTLGIDYRLSGGTLLGAIRDRSIPMAADDDLDIHVNESHRHSMFAEDFRETAISHGLQRLVFLNSTADNANKHGSCIRLVLLNTKEPVIDIFFTRDNGNGETVKLDGWSTASDTGVVTYTDSTKEIFPIADMFPLQNTHIDGMSVSIPRDPEKVLTQQYGPTVMSEVRPRSPFISHHIPFMLPFIWQR